jgi:4-hydroxymandelate oxidase
VRSRSDDDGVEQPPQVDDYAGLARSALPADVWGYVEGGGGAEWTLEANRAAYRRVALRPRVLVDVSHCDVTTTLLGVPLDLPIGIAPMAYHRLAHPDGEVATALAAGEAGALFVVSIFATRTVEEIAKAATGPLWLQLYWLRQRGIVAELAQRAEAAGYRALVLTVDTPRVARRLRDIRNSFTLPEHAQAVNVDASIMAASHAPAAGSSAIQRHSLEQFDSSITWADLPWLREQTALPLVLKGIVTAEDARRAVEAGVDAIVVSNHGGRQLDGSVASLEALPEVVAAVPDRVPVLLDGGVRSGADAFKALALGARVVLVGRPLLWGLAHSGAAGAAAVLRLLRDELEECMALAGRPTVAEIDASAVRVRA